MYERNYNTRNSMSMTCK